MQKIKRWVRLTAKQIARLFHHRPIQSQFRHDAVPYFCQWESREMAADLIAGKTKVTDDPQWRNSGAQTIEEYASWSWSGCGMACLKMILAAETGKTVPLVVLGKQCAAYGGYRMPLEDHPGLFYRPFVTFVEKEYGLQAKVDGALTLHEVLVALSDGKYVIASVSPLIRTLNQPPPRRGGHLVLILGYDKERQLLWLHNPSGTTLATQEYAQVTFKQFNQFFDHKGIIVWKPSAMESLKK